MYDKFVNATLLSPEEEEIIELIWQISYMYPIFF
jgi:hypothetical protein